MPPPAQRVFMVSDSVGLGAKNQMINAFPGWQATVTGKPGIFVEPLTTNYLQDHPQNPSPPHATTPFASTYPSSTHPLSDRAPDPRRP